MHSASNLSRPHSRGEMSVTVRSSQKLFTEEEVSGLTGVCLEHLRSLARSKHLGYMAILAPRCEHIDPAAS